MLTQQIASEVAVEITPDRVNVIAVVLRVVELDEKRRALHAVVVFLAAFDLPGRVRVNQGNVDDAFGRAAKVVEGTYSTPYLPRARMEPGNATVLVTDNRVDVWMGDQSPQEVRFSASKLTGIPEENVYVNLCHLGGGYGRNGNGPQAEQAIAEKRADYFATGTLVVWDVDLLSEEVVRVYRAFDPR